MPAATSPPAGTRLLLAAALACAATMLSLLQPWHQQRCSIAAAGAAAAAGPGAPHPALAAEEPPPPPPRCELAVEQSPWAAHCQRLQQVCLDYSTLIHYDPAYQQQGDRVAGRLPKLKVSLKKAYKYPWYAGGEGGSNVTTASSSSSQQRQQPRRMAYELKVCGGRRGGVCFGGRGCCILVVRCCCCWLLLPPVVVLSTPTPSQRCHPRSTHAAAAACARACRRRTRPATWRRHASGPPLRWSPPPTCRAPPSPPALCRCCWGSPGAPTCGTPWVRGEGRGGLQQRGRCLLAGGGRRLLGPGATGQAGGSAPRGPCHAGVCRLLA